MREDEDKRKGSSDDSLRRWATKHKRRPLIWSILLGLAIWGMYRVLRLLLFTES